MKDIEVEAAHRGLTGAQKLIVEEAFGLGKKSARQIISLFRSKRSQLSDGASKADFLPDPEVPKLKNCIQALIYHIILICSHHLPLFA